MTVPVRSTWLEVRDALIAFLEKEDFPVNREDLYAPEFNLDDLDEPTLSVTFAENAIVAEDHGATGRSLSLSLNIMILGRADDNAAADRLTALTQRVYECLTALDGDGHPNPPVLGDWSLQDVDLAILYVREKLAGSNRRWVGLIKVNAKRLE